MANLLIWPRLRIIGAIPFYALCLVLAGCFSEPKVASGLNNSFPFTGGDVTAAANNMNMLSWIGGLSILGGIAALVIT